MSYFDEQFEAWMDGDCDGAIEDVDLSDADGPHNEEEDNRFGRERGESQHEAAQMQRLK